MQPGQLDPGRVLRWSKRAALARGGALLAAGAVTAACRPAATPGEEPGAGAVPYKVISGNKFDAGERLEWAKLTAAEFSRINGPRLTAEHVIMPFDQLVPALVAGTGPDVTQSSGSWFSDFVEKGHLKEITPYVKRDKLDMNRWYVQEEVLFRKGKQYGMPFWQAHSVYLYNKTLFSKHAVKPPDNENWTWNDLLDAAIKLTRSGETFGLQMPFGFEFGWLNFLRSAGENYINKEKTKTTLNTPGAIEVFQWLVDLVLKHKVHPSPGDTSLGPGNWWYQGKIAIQLSGTGILGGTLTAKPDFEWDLFVTPKHPRLGKRGISSNENPMVVTKDSKNPEAAYKLALFFAEKYSQDLVGKFRINMPSLKASAADPAGWLSSPPPSMKVSLEQMKHAWSLDFHLNWSQWYSETIKVLTDAFRGQISVKEACDKASQLGDTLLRGV